MESLLPAASGPVSPASRQRHNGHSKNFRRNTFAALAICLIILGFAASPSNHQVVKSEKELRRHTSSRSHDSPEDVLQRMQQHTLTVEECTGSQCTKEVVNLHDTATLGDQQQPKSLHSQTDMPINTSDSRLASVSIQKQVGKPLVVTVKQDDSDPGQHVQSGGALLTDDAKDRVASLNSAASQQMLVKADPVVAERAAEVADELSQHNAAAHHEGDNVLEIHRGDIDLSSNAIDPTSLSNRTQISDDNNLQIMQDTDSSSLLSGFNSDKARSQSEQQEAETSTVQKADSQLGSARRHLLRVSFHSSSGSNLKTAT